MYFFGRQLFIYCFNKKICNNKSYKYYAVKRSIKLINQAHKIVGIFLLALLLLLLAVRAAGRLITGRTPKGGINESFFTDINGQEMWFSVYSEDPSLPAFVHEAAQRQKTAGSRNPSPQNE